MKKFCKLSPESYNEKDLFCTLVDVVNDYIPYIAAKKQATQNQEVVTWFKFHSFTSNNSNYVSDLLLLLVATLESFTIWILDNDGDCNLVYLASDKLVYHAEILPPAILAICYSDCLKFISLSTKEELFVFKSQTAIQRVNATLDYIVVARSEDIVIFDREFNQIFTLSNIRRNNLLTSKPIPFSLSPRWLAFPDSKNHSNYFSKCGETSSDENNPLTVTALSVNKKLWNHLSTITNTLVSTLNAQPSPTDFANMCTCGNAKNLGAEETSVMPGVVTIIDLKKLHEKIAQCDTTDSVDVHEYHNTGIIVAHFLAHKSAPVGHLQFDSSGSLLFTSCTLGNAFNVFRIANHPFDERQTAVHHLYTLDRGNTPCEILNATFSHDSRWVAVSSNHGTTHVYPITPYGGPVTYRTHSRSRVVNRASKYQQSSGFNEHHITRPEVAKGQSLHHCVCGLNESCPDCLLDDQREEGNDVFSYTAQTSASSMLTGSANTSHNVWHSTRIPPFPQPCRIRSEARLRPHAASSTSIGGAVDAVGQTAANTASEGVNLATCATNALTSKLRGGSSNMCELSCPLHASVAMMANQRPRTAPNVPPEQMAAFSTQPWYRPGSQMNAYDQTNRGSSLSLVHSVTGAQFHAPICCYNSMFGLVPSRTSSHGSLNNLTANLNSRGDPYAPNNRSTDSLFLLTWSVHLVEYEVVVTSQNQSSGSHGDFFEDGSIKVECKPVCQWPIARQLAELLASDKTEYFNDSVLPLFATCTESPVEEPSDSASLWCSQVELNTHLDPIKRLFMGPQFSFRTYHDPNQEVATKDDSSFLNQQQPSHMRTRNFSANDGRIHVELIGSLAESSGCGSGTSISRSNDDVLRSIAEAMQDDEHNEVSSLESGILFVPAGSSDGNGSLHRRTTIVHKNADELLLCESDFHSLDELTLDRASDPIDIMKSGLARCSLTNLKHAKEPSKLSLESVEFDPGSFNTDRRDSAKLDFNDSDFLAHSLEQKTQPAKPTGLSSSCNETNYSPQQPQSKTSTPNSKSSKKKSKKKSDKSKSDMNSPLQSDSLDVTIKPTNSADSGWECELGLGEQKPFGE